MAKCTVRYWAAAKDAAGTGEETVEADTLQEVVDTVCHDRADDHFQRVLGVSSILVNEKPVGARSHSDVVITEGSVIEVLPPFAGG